MSGSIPGREKFHGTYIALMNEIISLAGLFSEWVRSTTGEVLGTFTIITTDANEMMAEIHNSKKRMPAILDRTDEKKWMNLSLPPAEALSLLKPSPEEILKAHTISPLVNNRNANRNTPEVIQPYNYRQDTLFSLMNVLHADLARLA